MKKNLNYILSIALMSAIIHGCSTAKLSNEGSSVEVITNLERKDCKNLGPVFGKGGGSFGGTWIPDERLMEYASNDLRNKAAAKGATHVVVQNHQVGMTTGREGGSTSTVTQQGIAFQCPN